MNQEEKIQETIQKSKTAFLKAEQRKILSYHEFLWIQLKVIQKRWWILQLLILLSLWIVLSTMQNEVYTKKSMGAASSLFVILMIPELWKNRSCGCMEIEAASYYSLRQVYAARMWLFGITDILLITLFLRTASVRLHFELWELMIQFLFPLCVTAGICFGILCSRHMFSETTAMILCIIWSMAWLFLILDENIYAEITIPVWCALLGLAMLFAAASVYRFLRNCNEYLEVPLNEIKA